MPHALRDELDRVAKRLRTAQADVRWVRPEAMHLTLKFLGETMPEQVPPIKTALAGLADAHPFQIRLGGLGAFPHTAHPKVIWAGIEHGLTDLIRLAENIENRLTKLGWPREERPFRPHLTLGRVRSGHNRANLAALLDRPTPPFRNAITVSGAELIASTLTPAGPIYRIL